MVKFKEAENRKFKGVFVCRRCKTKQKAEIMKVLEGKIKCRKCNYKNLRVKKKKK